MSSDMITGIWTGIVIGCILGIIITAILDEPSLTDEHKIILWEHCYTQYETPSEIRDCLTELGLAVE